MPSYSDEDLLDEIRRVADVADADGAPTVTQFNEHSDIADSTIHRRFGSWNEGVAAAGFDPNPPETAIDEADLVDELQRLRDELGHPPKVDEMRDAGAYSPSTYKYRYGSWTAAVTEIFDDITESDLKRHRGDSGDGDRSNWSKGPHVSDDELLADLNRLADEVGRTPTSKDVRAHGSHSAHTYVKRFGSWGEALASAGLDDTDDTRTPGRAKVPVDDLIADLHRLRDELGTRPTSTDVAREGEYGLATYQRRFGSWGEAAAAAFDNGETDN